ncbi:type VII secretion protein EccB [Natronosporangium hydrolyticum]|uniref:Type VII secretion protein EccB n=1 Tax=Natronosporangium hydrolyticum TaxID=2811111 RepID=A0A895YCS7_9ACTN|nr:type VII secretion protein EccB [Natronosporangium hydrolyticum]QSB15311.1 type VII secretion protein EccB [Natronosporangium hydrolyticum]
MASRRDQLHSYQFMMQRVVSSVMVHETDPEQHPLRRGVGAAFAGVMVAALVAVAFGVYGVISGNQAGRWQEPGAIIIERETGAHYVYLADGSLQPVLNFTSAKLVSHLTAPSGEGRQGGLLGGLFGGGSNTSEPRRVASRNLVGLPRAATVGIPGAPESLPAADRSVGTPWTLCSTLDTDPAGSPFTTTTLVVGRAPSGGSALGDQALLVEDSAAGDQFLIWRSHRYRLASDEPEQLVRALYGLQAEQVLAGTAWLNGLPAGQDLGPIELPDRGDESSAVDGREIGAVVYHPVANGDQHYLVMDDGLAPLTELQLQLLHGQYQVEVEEISAAAAAAAPGSSALAPARGEAAPPPTAPELLPPPNGEVSSLCAETHDVESPPELTLGSEPAGNGAALPTWGESAEGARLADSVFVPPGEIAVVRSLPSASAPSGSFYLVTDLGIRYAVPSGDVLEVLGYTPDQAVDMPAALVQRIPAGPTLTPQAAQQSAPVGS